MRDRTLDRRRFLTLGAGALLAACSGATSAPGDQPAAAPSPTTPTSPSPTPSPTPSPSPTEPSASATPSPIPTRELPTGIVPTRVRIPAIGVDANCVELNLQSAEVEVPEDFDDTGWWVQTRVPGEIGPAVIGGHVDSTSGPAVFFRLEQLQVGDEITVADADGETRSFTVDQEPIQVQKDQRPPEVFGFGEKRPELRLITCGGDFDPSERSYVNNVVVFASDMTYEA